MLGIHPEHMQHLWLTSAIICCMYHPTVTSLITKRKKNQLHYYVVESAPRDGRPRIIHQTYLGNPPIAVSGLCVVHATSRAAELQKKCSPRPRQCSLFDIRIKS
jgi:hypothetical protein